MPPLPAAVLSSPQRLDPAAQRTPSRLHQSARERLHLDTEVATRLRTARGLRTAARTRLSHDARRRTLLSLRDLGRHGAGAAVARAQSETGLCARCADHGGVLSHATRCACALPTRLRYP